MIIITLTIIIICVLLLLILINKMETLKAVEFSKARRLRILNRVTWADHFEVILIQ